MQMNYSEVKAAPPAALALILAAERLMAVHGPGALTVRQINAAAQVRNSSAIHYHFGSVAGLLAAVLDHRMGPVNARRMTALDELRAAGRTSDQRAIVAALIWPLAGELAPRAQGNHYLRFLWRTLLDTDDGGSQIRTIDPALLIGWRAAEDLLRATMRYLPDAIVEFRQRMVRVQAISGLASLEASHGEGGAAPEQIRFSVEALIDALCAMVAGPVSPAVLALSGD